MEGVKNLTTAMSKKEACLGSLYANLNFNIPVPVGLACENPARIRE